MIRPFICLETLGISMNAVWLKWQGERWEGRRLGDSYNKNVREKMQPTLGGGGLRLFRAALRSADLLKLL
jgi:hypothetical protein